MPSSPPAQRGDPAAHIAKSDNAYRLSLCFGTHQGVAVDIRLAPQRPVRLNNALRKREQHCESVFGHRVGVPAGLVDHQHPRGRAGLDIDRIVARAIARDDQEIWRSPQQVCIDMEMPRKLIARRTDLVSVRGGQDRRGDFLRTFVLQSIEPHIRPRSQNFRIDLVCQILDVEHALVVDGHYRGLSVREI